MPEANESLSQGPERLLEAPSHPPAGLRLGGSLRIPEAAPALPNEQDRMSPAGSEESPHPPDLV